VTGRKLTNKGTTKTSAAETQGILSLQSM